MEISLENLYVDIVAERVKVPINLIDVSGYMKNLTCSRCKQG